IGHEIVGELDGDASTSIILNAYYTAKPNSYQEGTVRYQLFDLEPGEHSLSVRVWDVANNSSLAKTTFIVSDDAVMALDKILNYPNPLKDEGTTFLINHNQDGRELQITVDVFTLDGRRVVSLNDTFLANGNVYDGLNWDGTNELGQPMSNGIYVYRVRLQDMENGQSISEANRLVILRQ
ncbi:MAG: T9SS type A sorting domain-containing protein, partial [Bacteroidota bacterium]